MIITLALTSFLLLLIGLHFLLKDFTRFIWKKTKAINLPNSFVDFGEYAVTVFFVVALSVLGLLFYKFGTAFFAYLLSGDLISFFVTLRGVFSIESDIQNPFSFQHILSGLILTPALQFATFYFIYRSIRTFMFSINRYYSNSSYSESDVLYFGFLSSISFILLEIIFYSQNIPTLSGVAHLTYLAVSKLAAIGYYLAVAHIQLLKNDQYKNSLTTYVHLRKYETGVVFSPMKITFLTYLIGVTLYIPFYTGTQFMQNNAILISIYLISCALFYLILRFFLSGGFNYLGVVMLAESSAQLSPNGKLFEPKTEKKFLFAIASIALLFAILKLKLFIVIVCLITFALLLYIILHSLSYLLGLAFSIGRMKWKKQEAQEIKGVVLGKYLLTTVKAAAKATTPMIGLIYLVFVLFSFFPKKFHYKNENYVHSVFDESGSPMYIEHTDKNGCIPLSYSQFPKFFIKCLYMQEDRDFTNQTNWLPQKSNWHGISLATFYRLFSGGGGSNLNMQLIKNMAFPNGAPVDIQRKFAESLASYQLSLQCSDSVILTDYLNLISMNGGKNQSGLMKGSLDCFGLPIKELNPLEIMYLAATVKGGPVFKYKNYSVAYNDAGDHIEEIKTALLEQAQSWQVHGMLSKREYNTLRNQELRFTTKSFTTVCGTTTREFLLKQMRDSKLKAFTYTSSISNANQQRISVAVNKFDTQFQSFKKVQGCDLFSSALVIDVKTGKVIAHYGSEGVTDLTQFAGGNPVGSIIKPFVLIEMLEAGYKFNNILLYDGKVKGKLTPNNYNSKYSNKFVGINEILGISLNAPMVNIRQITDPSKLYKSVESHFLEMNISKDKFLNINDPGRKSEIQINYPLGSRNMTLYEIAQAYQTLFNKGKYLKLSVYNSSIDPLTNTIKEFKQAKRQIYKNENANLIAKALNNAMQPGGTGMHMKNLLPKDITFYAKTGTSDEARHGYTVLYDGRILIVTYVSYGRIENEHLTLGVIPIPFGSGGRSAGLLAAAIYNELN